MLRFGIELLLTALCEEAKRLLIGAIDLLAFLLQRSFGGSGKEKQFGFELSQTRARVARVLFQRHVKIRAAETE